MRWRGKLWNQRSDGFWYFDKKHSANVSFPFQCLDTVIHWEVLAIVDSIEIESYLTGFIENMKFIIICLPKFLLASARLAI